MKRIREQLDADNREYWLSAERRVLKNSGEDERAGTEKFWPTYSRLIQNKDMIANRMQRYRDRKRNGQRVRFWHGWGRNIQDTLAMGYHGILGSVERLAAIPMMLAGNAIKLTGKIAKMPLHFLSGTFNTISKWAGSDARWRMDSVRDTWKKGWVGYNDGRSAFRNLLKLGVILPIASSLERVFLELLQFKRIWYPDGKHFAILRNYMKDLHKISKKHLRHVIKGMGINSKHYKDRSLLTPEDMGMVDTRSYDTDEDDDESFGGNTESRDSIRSSVGGSDSFIDE